MPAVANAAPPANDSFATATTYPKPGEEVGTNVDATRETNEPDTGEQTVWWKWTASEDGRYRLDDCATVPQLSTVIGVYSGSSVSALTEVTRNRDAGGCDDSNMESVYFDALAGSTYRFSVGSRYSDEESSNIRLSLRRTEVNDNFTSAAQFTPVPGTVVGANKDSTRETGEPETGERTVWWRWTATETARYRFDDCETVPTLSTVLGVYTGDSVSSLVEIVRNRDGGGCSGSSMAAVFFDAVAGTEYKFSVGSRYTSESSANLRVSLRPTAPNDNFANALGFAPVPGTVSGNNVEATREDGEPENGARTIWWMFTAADSASYRLDDCQTAPAVSTELGVFSGDAVTSLQQIPTTAGTCTGANTSGLRSVAFNAVAGTTYHFSVGTSSSGDGSANIRLRLQRLDSPACVKAKAGLAAATKAAGKAKKRTATAKAALRRAKRALKNARARAARAGARNRVKSANRKLASARAKQRKANKNVAARTAAQQAAC